MGFYIFAKLKKIYSLERQTERDRDSDMHTDFSFIYWLAPRMTRTTKAGCVEAMI